MAAAYASLVSLTHIIDQVMVHHARQPIFLNKQQRQIDSLRQKVSFLQKFLEVYSHEVSNIEEECLGSRIADAAYAAADVIESRVVDILFQAPKRQQPKEKNNEKIKFTSHGRNRSNHFSQGLQKVIENIDSIRKEVVETKEKSRVKDQQPRDLVPIVSSRHPPTGKDTMVGYYDKDFIQIMDKLTGESSSLQIIPIVGMGGIGKTTFAKNIYDNSLIVETFHIRAWVTISQECNLPKVLLDVLTETGVPSNKEEQKGIEYHQFGEKLYKHLSGRKYLLIMDDMWSFEVWEKLKLFLPDNNNGSRVMVTTRLSNVANNFGSSHLYKMHHLDVNKSWILLCRKVFGYDGNCPLELEEIGKDIAKNCKGLPLSIVVVGGLLAKSELTRNYWEYVSKYINQIVNSEDDGLWLKILSLSYTHLPIHLKPCFLYMGVYPEDYKICVSKLIKLWVAEGFLKPDRTKNMEEVAEDYLKDLIERNLILVCEWGSVGKMKTCSIHDLLRDLCLREAQKEMFLGALNVDNHVGFVDNEGRHVFYQDWSGEIDFHRLHHALPSTPFIRSLVSFFNPHSSSCQYSLPNLRLLRVLAGARAHSLKSIFQLVNLRFLKCDLDRGASAILPPMCRLWYLQTLIITGNEKEIIAPNEIWKMPQLRHIIVKSGIRLPDPLSGQMDEQHEYVLRNLQTLSQIINFKCTEEVLKRIPHINKLVIQNEETGTSNHCCLQNLCRLHKLQSLTCIFSRHMELLNNLTFPQSLNKLMLQNCYFEWDDFTPKVGSLPHLEKLKLDKCYGGAKWHTVEGKFLRLKFLEMIDFGDLVCWTADSTHFPLLERLVLSLMWKLKEIPSGVGDTLKSIELVCCRSSVIASAKVILEEQHGLGNEGLHLTVNGNMDLIDNPILASWLARSV